MDTLFHQMGFYANKNLKEIFAKIMKNNNILILILQIANFALLMEPFVMNVGKIITYLIINNFASLNVLMKKLILKMKINVEKDQLFLVISVQMMD